MIYNCYVKDNQYFVDIAKSDEEIITKKFKFSMLIGFLNSNIPTGNYKFLDDQDFTELYSGLPLTTIGFTNYYKYLAFRKLARTDKFIFGDIDPIYYCMTSHFKEPLKVFNPRFYTLDIEVYSKTEFPDPFKAEYVMNLVTICDYQMKKYYTWGLKPFTNDSDFDVEYYHCEDELTLIENLIQFIEDNNIKCFTGWNTNGFDVPYIINRMRRFENRSFIIAEYIKENINMYGRDKSFITLQVIDYMELYKKLKAYKLERYSLDFVSVHEGFEGKNKYKGTLAELSDDNWHDYVLYNVVDNYKIIQLEEKLKYIKQAFSLANDSKCLPTDIFSPVKMWDSATYFELFHNRKCLVPPLLKDIKWKLIGGFVGLPNTNGFQNYISVFDIASSYPHQIMEFNISPETIIGAKKLHADLKAIREHYTPSLQEMIECPDLQFKQEITSLREEMRRKGLDFIEDNFTEEDLNIYRVKYNIWRFSRMDLKNDFPFTETLIKHNVTMTVNLQFFKKDKVGFIPYLIEKFFNIRNEAKQNSILLKYHIDLIQKQIGIEENKELEYDDVELLDEEDLLDEEII